MPDAFVDTNIILRHLLGDHPDQSPRATAFFTRVERGDFRIQTSDMVVFEAIFTLERSYRLPKAEIRLAVLPLIDLPGVRLSRKDRIRRAFDAYVLHNVPFADAYHAVLCRDSGFEPVASFDRDFDRIPGIRREEP